MNINNSHPEWARSLECALHQHWDPSRIVTCVPLETDCTMNFHRQPSCPWARQGRLFSPLAAVFLQSLAKFRSSSPSSCPISLESNSWLARYLLIRMTQAKGQANSCLDTLNDADRPRNMLALHCPSGSSSSSWLGSPVPLSHFWGAFQFTKCLKFYYLTWSPSHL